MEAQINLQSFNMIRILLLSLVLPLTSSETERPVIGIFSQPYPKIPDAQYIAASYVKFLEHGGARAVRVPYDATEEELTELLPSLNGVLFPGGEAEVPPAAYTVYEFAKKVNDDDENDDVFPLWGTCLGFEWMAILASNDPDILGVFNAENISLALNLTDDAAESTMFADDRVREIAGSEPVTFNNHQQGLSPAAFQKSLSSSFTLLSTNFDLDGLEFVSSFEGINSPYFGVQWHPEKNNFEFGVIGGSDTPYEAIDHSSNAIRVTQEMARVFVDKARGSKNVFKGDDESFPLIILDKGAELLTGTSFEEIYVWA